MSLIEGLIGFELGMGGRFFVAFVIVLLAIGGVAWAIRRFTGRGDIELMGRGRQPRLGVLEALAIDQRRRLVLVRRDNIEHLILIGGPADVVVEAAIMRGAPAQVAEAARAAQQRGPAGRPAGRPGQPAAQAASPQAPASQPQPAPTVAPVAPEPANDTPAPRPQRVGPRRGPVAETAEPAPRGQPPQLHAVNSDKPAPAPAPATGGERAAPRRGDTGLTAAASALEQALRRPFGGGRAQPAAEPENADIAESEGAEVQGPAAEPHPARRPEPAAAQGRSERAERPRSEPRSPFDDEEDAPATASQPVAARRLNEVPQGRGTASAGEGRSTQAGAGRERPASPERNRDAAPTPQAPSRAAPPFTPMPGTPPRPALAPVTPAPEPIRANGRAAPPEAPEARPAPRAEPRPPREARSGGSEAVDIVVSRADRPAPVSLEDEMASLLDEIAGGRER